ncbi:MAG: hypothetical protein LBT61_03300, partial [Prevotellaceae bacterium]|nr:hypothetical protein [Prevotellaceae bacterium]
MKTKIIKNIQIVGVALLLYPIMLPAQNGVTVSNLAVNAGTVTFEVGWGKNTVPSTVKPWSDTVWVFVDY